VAIKGLFAIVLVALAFSATLKAEIMQQNGRYADVNGQHLYHTIQGRGKPLIVLHGGILPDSFGDNLESFAKQRQVIAVHLRGHGHSTGTGAPFSLEAMADDIAALIAFLGLEKADVLGYSTGSGVALHTAIRHADVVDRLVLISAVMSSEGYFPEVSDAFHAMAENAKTYGEEMRASEYGKTYPNVDWIALFEKSAEMESVQFDLSEDVMRIEHRTLLVFADADMMTPEHTVSFWKNLGGGQRDAGLDGSDPPLSELAILPGSTHYNIATDRRLPAMIDRFLGR
jgi:pimeloyl-ACP methyl ester carboxylesterase